MDQRHRLQQSAASSTTSPIPTRRWATSGTVVANGLRRSQFHGLAAAFQLAVWEIVFDTDLDVTSGSSGAFKDLAGHSTGVAQAQSWLDGVASYVGTGYTELESVPTRERQRPGLRDRHAHRTRARLARARRPGPGRARLRASSPRLIHCLSRKRARDGPFFIGELSPANTEIRRESARDRWQIDDLRQPCRGRCPWPLGLSVMMFAPSRRDVNVLRETRTPR